MRWLAVGLLVLLLAVDACAGAAPTTKRRRAREVHRTVASRPLTHRTLTTAR